MAKLASQTYGDALFAVAKEKNSMDSLVAEAEMCLELLRENKEYLPLINHPKIPEEKKVSLIEEAFQGKVSEDFFGFLATVVQKGRFSEIESILLYFLERVREEKKIGTATVTSARKLSDKQRQEVEKRLLETTNYQSFSIDYRVDESLIGGVVIRIGDRVADGSIRTQLANMAKDLSSIQLA